MLSQRYARLAQLLRLQEEQSQCDRRLHGDDAIHELNQRGLIHVQSHLELHILWGLDFESRK